MRSSTWLHLRGVIRTNRWMAFACIVLGLPRRHRGLLGDVLTVAAEHPGGHELTELVPHHVLGDVDRNELVAVVDGERVPDELGKDGAAPRPGLEHALLPAAVESLDLLDQGVHHVRSLFDRTRHVSPSYFVRRRTMNESPSLRRRVLRPLVFLPHGVVGWRPPELLPSPPPIG